MTENDHDLLKQELRAALEREERLTAELQRRVTNMLSVVRSLFTRTLAASENFEDVTLHFGGRLSAFARVQAALVRSPWGVIELEDLVRDELLHFSLNDGPRLEIDGPAVRLRGQAAELIGMALHELATNAAKFGMLATPTGRLAVRWTVTEDDGARRLRFRWQERDIVVDPVAATDRFGRDLIETGLPYQIGAETSFDLQPTGLLCTIDLPLDGDFGATIPEELEPRAAVSGSEVFGDPLR